MDKNELRDTMTGLAPVSTELASTISNHLFGFLSARLPGTIAAYRAMADEVDIANLIARLPGWHWLLPRVEEDGTLTWREAGVDLEAHRWGMEQPKALGPVTPTFQIDVFLVPGIAFARDGCRLGRGGGFYDRELAHRRGDSIAVGVAPETRVLETVPTDPHDERVTHLVTELGIKAATPTM